MVTKTKGQARTVKKVLTSPLKKGLSGASTHKIKQRLSAIFTVAVKKEIMRRNPCKLVTPIKIDTPPAAYLDEEQSFKLLDTLNAGENQQLNVIVNLMLASGIRPGECTALHWEDINLDTGLMQIRHTLIRFKRKYILETPKTENSNRHIVLPPYIIGLLVEHKRRQDEYLESIGEASLYNGSIFINAHGDYFNPVNINTQLKRAIEGLGLPEIHLYSLRHTHASLLINADIPAKIVANRLGHALTKTTLDTYSHVFAASEVRAMQAVDMKLFQRNTEAASENGERL